MKKGLMVVWVLVTVCGVRAEILAGWNVNEIELDVGTGLDAPGAPYTFSATTSETHRVSAQLTLGDGVAPSTAKHQYGFKIPSSVATHSLAEAIDAHHYLEFSLTVSAGYALHLDTIEMNGQASGTGCSNVVLMTSRDGFSDGLEIASVSPANTTGSFDTDSSGFGAPIDLSDATYQNLTGTVSFRLYGWNSASGSGTTYLRNLSGNDLVVSGTVAALSSENKPTLSWIVSNGTASVSAVFNEANSTDYILQHSPDLSESNVWSTASGSFASNTIWQIETTNRAGFYRAIAQ